MPSEMEAREGPCDQDLHSWPATNLSNLLVLALDPTCFFAAQCSAADPWQRDILFRRDHQQRHVEEAARQAGDVAGLRLYMEQDNARAEATYIAMGMTRTHYVVLEQVPLG